MTALSEGYRSERPQLETPDFNVLVIRALLDCITAGLGEVDEPINILRAPARTLASLPSHLDRRYPAPTSEPAPAVQVCEAKQERTSEQNPADTLK
jgi:hypothetical protein